MDAASILFPEDKYLGQSGGVEAVRNENARIAEEIQLLDQEMVRNGQMFVSLASPFPSRDCPCTCSCSFTAFVLLSFNPFTASIFIFFTFWCRFLARAPLRKKAKLTRYIILDLRTSFHVTICEKLGFKQECIHHAVSRRKAPFLWHHMTPSVTYDTCDIMTPQGRERVMLSSLLLRYLSSLCAQVPVRVLRILL